MFLLILFADRRGRGRLNISLHPLPFGPICPKQSWSFPIEDTKVVSQSPLCSHPPGRPGAFLVSLQWALLLDSELTSSGWHLPGTACPRCKLQAALGSVPSRAGPCEAGPGLSTEGEGASCATRRGQAPHSPCRGQKKSWLVSSVPLCPVTKVVRTSLAVLRPPPRHPEGCRLSQGPARWPDSDAVVPLTASRGVK